MPLKLCCIERNADSRDVISPFCDVEPYTKMSEWPSWCEKESGGEPAWAEYLMWESAKGTRYPMKLEYKYYNNPENDAEYERRVAYAKEE